MGTLSEKEVTELVGIGLCQPKFYKRSVWRKAQKVMETLCDNSPFVERFNLGHGKSKYRLTGAYTNDFIAREYLRIDGAIKVAKIALK